MQRFMTDIELIDIKKIRSRADFLNVICIYLGSKIKAIRSIQSA
jgi:hypothetical protein